MKKQFLTFFVGALILASTLVWASGNIFTVKLTVMGASTTVSSGETGYFPVLNLNNVAGYGGPVELDCSFMMHTLTNATSGSTINFYYRQSSADDASNPAANCWTIARKNTIVQNCDTSSGNTEGYIYDLNLEPAQYIRFEVTTGTTDITPTITVTFIGSK